MDIDSYIDYLAINTWVGNIDWSEEQNDMYWRVKKPFNSTYADGKYRWILHDEDQVFYDDIHIFSDKFREDNVIYNGLINNADFRHRFVSRLRELGTTCFSEENIKKHIRSGKWDEQGLDDIEDFFLNRRKEIYNVEKVLDY